MRHLCVPASVLLLSVLLSAQAVAAQRVSFPERPPAGVYHVDETGTLGAAEAAEVGRISAALLQEQDVPIVVVMLRDLASRGAAGYTIERYSQELFDHWGIGSQEHNYGMLLLVSVGDRRARIELGEAWRHRYDDQAQYVMNSLIVPEFREGRYSEGVLAGVRGMDAMARGLDLPAPRSPWWAIPAAFGVFAGVTALMFSLLYSGRGGWAWVVLAALGTLLFFLLATSARRAGQGDGGGGGAFRGGSSGGGGATGSW